MKKIKYLIYLGILALGSCGAQPKKNNGTSDGQDLHRNVRK
jgi:hypothetical protein